MTETKNRPLHKPFPSSIHAIAGHFGRHHALHVRQGVVFQPDLETWQRRSSQSRTEHAEEGSLDSPCPWDTHPLLSYDLLDLLVTSRSE